MVWYLRVEWVHSFSEEPVEIYSEVGDDGYEVRKIELFRDGHLQYADERHEAAGTSLSETPVGTVAEIAADEEFRPRTITGQEFEEIWARAVATRDG
ncbi:DUF6881 domain-containing protein [Actinomadura citrea]|uniref:DUF6881 domain-containing protein n=1 Tax=Actinomadura citrea TaxID=46158 RepID=A0A7Y9GK58_9ACTN|nr:hypothetical protein [Actinomadura citrea]NYE17952.1 hypothetical protein [Actinomadura citrea]GGT62635.1 hypothetical protein GCM10010177_19570 [Actinomadura citrea]